MTTGEKLANSVWGLVLARYVTPGLVGIIVVLGGFVTSGLFTRIDKLADAQDHIMSQMSAQAIRITAMETRAEIVGTTRLADVERMLSELMMVRGKLDTTVTQVAGLAAKMDVLLTRGGSVPPSNGVQ